MNLEFGFWHHFQQTEKVSHPITQFEEYNGETNIQIACTQLGTTPKFQNQVIDKWCDAFYTQKLPIKKLWFTSRISQKIIDAICHQSQIEGLWIKWGVYNNIEKVAELKNLQYLHLGGGSSIEDISVVSGLIKLKSFEASHLYKINDYSFLTNLEDLVDLCIEGDAYSAMKKVNIKSLNFLGKMPQLIRLSLCMTKIGDESYLPVLKIKSLEHLEISPNDRDFKKDIGLFKRFGK